jgi:two-component system sensor histidine kinase SenX3
MHDEVAAHDAVLSAMSEGVLLFEPGGLLEFSNGAARRILGRSHRSAGDIDPRVLRDAILEVGEQGDGLGDHEPTVRQFETVDAVIEATVQAALPAGSVVVVLRDVTRARAIERLRRDFVANASHELKTPVASILALSSVLRSAASDDPRALTRFLAMLEGEAERLAALVRDLLELSRLEGGSPDRVEVQLDHIVHTATEGLRWRAEGSGLKLTVDVARPLHVLGSAVDLTHMVHNLVDNAIRYTPSGGSVRVSAAPGGGGAELTVEDSGIGIPPGDLGRVFERFYRVDVARSRETGGTGLGLSIVRNIAEAHGGAVQVESRLGAGSTFVVRLPLRAESSDILGAASQSMVPSRQPSRQRPQAERPAPQSPAVGE